METWNLFLNQYFRSSGHEVLFITWLARFFLWWAPTILPDLLLVGVNHFAVRLSSVLCLLTLLCDSILPPVILAVYLWGPISDHWPSWSVGVGGFLQGGLRSPGRDFHNLQQRDLGMWLINGNADPSEGVINLQGDHTQTREVVFFFFLHFGNTE